MQKLMNLYYWYSYLFKYHTRSSLMVGSLMPATFVAPIMRISIGMSDIMFVPFVGIGFMKMSGRKLYGIFARSAKSKNHLHFSKNFDIIYT